MVDIAKIGVMARIKSAMTYFQEKNAFYVLRIQFMYENAPKTFGRYQVFKFTFAREDELARCVDSFKAFLGISKLADIKDQKVELYVYNENGRDSLKNAELLMLNSEGHEHKHWYPCAVGISEEPHNMQTIFSY